MLPHHAYQKQRELGMTRIELILALYDKTEERLVRIDEAIARGEMTMAGVAASQAQAIVTALASGMVGNTDELSLNFLRLYEFVVHKLSQPTAANVADARKIVAMLREGFEAARDAALRLEREGGLPTLDGVHAVEARA